jgi:hypothetical protein
MGAWVLIIANCREQFPILAPPIWPVSLLGLIPPEVIG